jgi:hypothetical protein
MLYAVDIFDTNLSSISSTAAFNDPKLPVGFAPFNIQRIGREDRNHGKENR